MAADNKFQQLILCEKCVLVMFLSGFMSFCRQLGILISSLQDVSNFL